MSLLRDIAGLYGDAEDHEGRAQLAAVLTGHASLYLQGGGALSLQDWLSLDQAERAAFAAAGKTLLVQQAMRIGQAARGDLAALRVHAELDGGKAHDDALLSAAVRSLATAAKGVTHGS